MEAALPDHKFTRFVRRRLKRPIVRTWRRLSAKARRQVYARLDQLYIPLDKAFTKRSRNLRLIPLFADRRGGKTSYVEWGFMIGIFQTLLNVHLEKRLGYHILDVGCGTGLMAVASEPFVQDDGHYIGIDVSLKDIQFCQSHYKQPYFEFQYLNAYNARYAADGSQKTVPWDVASGSIDAVTAVSVWTHLNEQDACFYFSEIERVLKPGGKALITFFLLDEFYDATVDSRTDQQGAYDMTPENQWIFDMPLSPSGDWRYPQRVEVPESAIGVTPKGVKTIIEGLSLIHKHTYLGSWKRLPGGSFQDVLVFEKP